MNDLPEHRLSVGLLFDIDLLEQQSPQFEFCQNRMQQDKRYFEEGGVPLVINQVVGGCQCEDKEDDGKDSPPLER